MQRPVRAGRAAVAETRLDVVVEEESASLLLDRLRHEVDSARAAANGSCSIFIFAEESSARENGALMASSPVMGSSPRRRRPYVWQSCAR